MNGENNTSVEWAQVRAVRDALLLRSDPAVLLAYELGEPVADDVRAYRQALRELPQKFGDPAQVVWPKAPDSLVR
ncbi:MAG: phage tail assembly chaperone [Afipia sp.]